MKCLLVALLIAAAVPAQAVQRLAWLAGCWAAEKGEPGSGEQWMAPAGGTLLGMSRTVRQGRTVEHEFMQIRAEADGTLVFIAQPSGQKGASFRATKVEPGEVVFENPEHDFPQRIAYRALPGGRLLARTDGKRDGRERAIDFAFVRAPCAEGPAMAAAAPLATPAAAAPPPPAARFGLEDREAQQGVQEIRSTIPGLFQGWRPNQRIKLANGQVWQVSDDSSAFMNLRDPIVVVRRAAMGSFRLEFEGQPKAVRVRRVE